MEQIKKERTPLRSAFTRIANLLETSLKLEIKNVDEIDILYAQLCEKWAELHPKEKDVLNYLLNDESCPQDNYNKEYESFCLYEEKFVMLRTKVQKLSKISEIDNSTKRKFKLPKIEFMQFGGDIKEWLAFWAQFEKIHNDDEIAKEDKYQYLLQATLKGSRAREIVESYPATGDSYENVIECLKARFGRTDMLIEVYIREVLTLMMNNALGKGTKIPLFKLYDKLETYLRSLKMLGVSSEHYSSILYPLIESCLPVDILRIWERNLNSMSLKLNSKESDDKLDLLMQFLRHEIESEEKVRLARSGFNFENVNRNVYPTSNRRERDNFTAAELCNSSQSKNESCVFCSKSHLSTECKNAANMAYEERKQILMRKGACFRCLGIKKHSFRHCKMKVPICECGKTHLKVMCPETSEYGNPITEKSDVKIKKDSVLANKTSTRQVLLQTLIVRLRCKNKMKYIRVLIDSGSSKSYLSTFALTKMGYECIGEENLTHSLFGGIETVVPHKKYLIGLSDFFDKYRCRIEVLDQEKICSDISKIPHGSFMTEIKKHRIFLSDLNKNVELLYEFSPNEVHGLIGADIAGKLYTGKMKQLDCGLVLMQTHLGWTLMGKTDENGTSDSTNNVMSLHVNDAKISDLWRLDTLGILDPGERGNRRELEMAAEEHFNRSLKIDAEGRYEVSLPWIQNHPPLPTCREIAERRLKSCVDSLKKNKILEEYEAVFKEWIQEGVIEEVENSYNDESEHYMPHRAVIKETSTTRVRPVFDGSARQKNSPSINDCLEKGPNTVELIPAILNRFRLKKLGVTADIRRAFLQISLNERDRPFLKFLWWEEGDPAKLKIMQHKRVVFGLTCSPYLLGATIQYHLKNVSDKFKETAVKLLESFYVDNCVTSVDDYEELEKFIEESKEIMRNAKFELRGWEYNQTKPESEDLLPLEEKKVPVLGLIWKLKNDTLTIDLRNVFDDGTPVTKRTILSAAHKIFDPIGFTCPVTLGPKVLLQECWKLRVSWDAELPQSITKKFEKWRKEISKLNEIEIPRCLSSNYEVPENLSLHVFCDASKIAYATCIFLRNENESSISCQLVQARSRVAPMNTISIPRLELLSCSIGARLAQNVKNDLQLKNISTYFWSDSANALYWIKGTENWTPFVFNRVKEIRAVTEPENWYHIPGSLNAADLPSRGCNVEPLVKSRWWEGPAWLRKPIEEWPKSNAVPDFSIVNSEKRKGVISATNHEESSEKIYDRYSSYDKLLRIVAWVCRYITNCKVDHTNRISGILTLEEINKAEISLLKIVQRESFLGPEDKRLKSLQCYVDPNGLLKVKTRIVMREDTKNFRFPILLPSSHPVVEKLVRTRHLNLSHAGTQILMCNLREDYWILKYRKTVKKIVKSCVRCKRFDSRPKPIIEAPLPEDRIKETAVFEVIGIDYTGPLILRGAQKVWIVIFTCAVYRAIHLDIATSLSTDIFLQTFRRFIARRGRPTIVYSDNGTSFTGADNLLKNIDWNMVGQYSTAQKITWKFNPPSAPWWGGWWERLIGIIKGILRKVLGRSSLNLEEMHTVLCDTESIVNQRPLTYVSEEIDDLTPLTPAMFLHDIKESGIPDLDKLDSSSINKRHVYRQRIKEDLRKRFRSEYLGYLRQSTKFDKNSRPIQVGDVVLVSSENTKKLQWPLAKVTELYPSKDGHIRLVKVKMKGGEFLRPVLRLIPLELNHEDNIRPPSATRISTSSAETAKPNPRGCPKDPVPSKLIVPLPDKDCSLVPGPNKTMIRSRAKDCLLETDSTEPAFQKAVYGSSVVTVPEKRSRYGRLLKPKKVFEFH